jgi:hypothetical protein
MEGDTTMASPTGGDFDFDIIDEHPANILEWQAFVNDVRRGERAAIRRIFWLNSDTVVVDSDF